MNASKGKILSIFLCFYLLAGNASASHTITQWRHNLSGAISLTFDDGYDTQITNAVPILNSRNLKATFFIVTGDAWFSEQKLSWEQWQNIAGQGHEIGSHTVTHPKLTQLSENEIREELYQSRKMINQHITSQSCISFCYPYNDYNTNIQSITGEYYIASRRAGGLSNSYDEFDRSLVKAGHISNLHIYLQCADENMLIQEKMRCLIETVKSNGNWFVLYWHEIKNEEKDIFKAITDSMTDKDVWVDTFGNVSRYMIQKTSSKITVISESSQEIKIDVTHSLDPLLYNMPLTIRSSVPQSWTEIQIRQAESVSQVNSTIESGETIIYYDIVPNAGVINISPATHSTSEISVSPESLLTSPAQGDNALDQSFKIWNSGDGGLSYSISVNENWLSCLPEQGTSAGEKDTIAVTYLTSSLISGKYFAKITVVDDASQILSRVIPVTLIIRTPDNEDKDGDEFTEAQGDCDDTDNTVYPGAPEICGDGIDQDCDGNDLSCNPEPSDVDNDGDSFSENQGDCNDTDNSVYPGAPEICGDGIDQDCDTKDEKCLNDYNNSNGGGCFISRLSK